MKQRPDIDAVHEWVRGWVKVLRESRKEFLSDATVDSVHKLRTTSRRLSEAVAVADGSGLRAKRTKRRLRRIRRHLGDLRNLDVCGAIQEQDEHAPEAFVRHLADLRNGLVAKAEGAIERIWDGRFKRDLDTLGKASVDFDRVRNRMRDRRDAYGQLVDQLVAYADPTDAHPTRIAGKRYRYTLEIALGGDTGDAELVQLKKRQDHLGEWHDFVTLESLVVGFCADQDRVQHSTEAVSQALAYLSRVRSRRDDLLRQAIADLDNSLPDEDESDPEPIPDQGA